METAAKPQKTSRSTDRLLEALSTLAALLDRTIHEVKSVDEDFQARLLKTVHDTETSLQSQAAEHLERAVADTREQIRQELTASFTAQIDAVRAEFETECDRLNRELNRTTEATALIESERQWFSAELDSTREECDRLNREVNRAAETAAPLESERQRLNSELEVAREECQRANRELKRATEAAALIDLDRQRLSAELDAAREECDRLNRELNRAAEANALLESERLRLSAELDRERENAQAQIEKARAAAAAGPAPAPSPNGSGNPTAIKEEITRTETRLREIVALIDNPSTELSSVIRKNVERSELVSYLKGIRFALGNGK